MELFKILTTAKYNILLTAELRQNTSEFQDRKYVGCFEEYGQCLKILHGELPSDVIVF